jgi:hypothetical protein
VQPMPSSLAHQTLVLWGLRGMTRDGFRIAGVDGTVPQGDFAESLAAPPVVAGVRPDAWGLAEEDGTMAFVEAKTESDIDNQHTRQQLRVLGNLRMRDSGRSCPVYLAIPRGAAYALDRVLIDLGLLRAKHIRRMHVPQALLEH